MKRINLKYPESLKLKIVKSYLNGDSSLQKLAIENGIKSKSQVYAWIKKYQEEGEDAFKFEKRGNPNLKKLAKENITFNSSQDEIQILRLENNYLRRYCEVLKELIRKERAFDTD